MNRKLRPIDPNPYAASAAGQPDAMRAVGSQTVYWFAVPVLFIASAWVVYDESYLLGVLLPAAIGVVLPLRYTTKLSAMLCGIVLAYLVGGAAIVLAMEIYRGVVSFERLFDDGWIRIEAAIYMTAGLIGSVCGAALVRSIAIQETKAGPQQRDSDA